MCVPDQMISGGGWGGGGGTITLERPCARSLFDSAGRCSPPTTPRPVIGWGWVATAAGRWQQREGGRGDPRPPRPRGSSEGPGPCATTHPLHADALPDPPAPAIGLALSQREGAATLARASSTHVPPDFTSRVAASSPRRHGHQAQEEPPLSSTKTRVRISAGQLRRRAVIPPPQRTCLTIVSSLRPQTVLYTRRSWRKKSSCRVSFVFYYYYYNSVKLKDFVDVCGTVSVFLSGGMWWPA